jgi:signal transduction histidine kinase
LASKIIDKILIPIKNITKTSKEITINNFKNTISQNEEYELKELINSFNEMIQRLQNEVASLDRFNTNVSHELKTPITIIKGEIAITLKKLRSAEYYQNSLISISQEINNIQKITDNLLLLTKYTKTNIIETFENCDLDTILLEVIEKYNQLLNQKNININLKIKHIKFRCNSQLIYHVFSNLIDNAIKYSPKNSTINISLYKNEKINFIIEDKGIGIDKNEIHKITEEFYQINKSTKGFGLGLNIVKYGVLLHNGKLEITSNKGVKVHIIF